LMSFSEGPPFTLQRLCEILLDARCIYPSLSKLALAVEKDLPQIYWILSFHKMHDLMTHFIYWNKQNLLVTTTLTKSTDPYLLSTVEQSDVPKEEGEVFQTHTNSVEENGGAPPTRDMDEIMTEVEAAGINDMTIEKVRRKQLILSFWSVSSHLIAQTQETADGSVQLVCSL
ncbi:hypothetical protein Ancab_019349, partial [Ancistrocladus abbreviatus]